MRYWLTLLYMIPGLLSAERAYPPYDPYQGQFYLELGTECLRRTGPTPMCLELLETARELDPRSGPLQLTLGQVYAGLGRLDDAVGAFARVLELDPTRVEAHLALGDLYVVRGELEAAKVSYGKFVTARPDDPIGPYSLGAVAALQLKEAEALALLRQSVKLGFVDGAGLKADPRWRNVLGSPDLEDILAGLPKPPADETHPHRP